MDEELRKLLGEALAGQVMEKLGDNKVFMYAKDKKVLIDDGQLIPKHRLDEVLESKKALQTIIDQNDKDMKELKKAAAGNSDLTAQIESLQKASKDAKVAAEQEAIKLSKSFALKESLMNAGVLDADARDLLALKFDPTKIELDAQGKVKGFDEMLKPIKENKALAGMFGEVKIAGQTHGQGGTPDLSLGEYATKNPFSPKTLNLMEQIKLRRDNPALADKLNALAQVTT